MSPKPCEQRRQVEHPAIRGGCLVVASGDRPILFEPVEAAFDHVAAPIGHRIEHRWPATSTAPTPPVGLLIDAFGDRGSDTATAQVSTDRTGGISLIGQHPPRSLPGLPPAGFRHPDPGQHLGEHCAIVDVARSQHERQRPAMAVTRQMDFRSRTTTRAPDGMINWFAVPVLGSVVPLCEPRVLVPRRRAGEHARARNPPTPRDRVRRPLPRSPALAARASRGCRYGTTAKTGCRPFPRPVPFGQIPPRHTGLGLVEHRVQHPPVIHPRTAFCPRDRQQRLDRAPLFLGQLMPTRHDHTSNQTGTSTAPTLRTLSRERGIPVTIMWPDGSERD